MTDPRFYPHRPSEVELRQTHASYVFLAGPYVYKIKKPVRFTFLDYSTLERRHHFCREEVRLNRRLAPALYLGVVAIVDKGERLTLHEEPGTRAGGSIVEYAVKMHRLSEEQLLSSRLSARKVGGEELSAIAEKLVAFHGTACAERAALYGKPEVIGRNIADNFADTERFIGETIGEKEMRYIREYSDRFLAEHGELFERRAREGRVREGHGDLRAEHIALTDGVVIFDCIEFNEALRYCDVASEIAFLAMDMDFLGAADLSTELVELYRAGSGDEMELVLPFYKCYRAYVRGKVESLKSRQAEVPEAERDQARARARRYFRLAYRYAKGGFPPAIVIVCGMVGTGKSTLARELASRAGFELLQSDRLRKELAGIPMTARTVREYGEDIYSSRFTELTYAKLLEKAGEHLEAGRGVILDATFKDPKHRWLARELAERLAVPFLFVECRAGEKEIFRRLKAREQQTGEASDATWEVYIRQREDYVPLDEVPERHRLTVDTESGAEDAVERVEEFLYSLV